MNRKAVVLVLSLLTICPGALAFAQTPDQLSPIEKLGGYTFFYQLSPIEKLGRHIFFDKNLSINRNQACAACHGPEVGWTGPDSAINATGAVYEGSVPGRFGNRKPPASAYAGNSPILHFDATKGWVGGMFWDGRATGWTLGDPLAEQAQGPFLNPLEQALPSAADVVARVCDSYYAYLFKWVWGSGACIGTVTLDYERIARSIAAYERSKEVTAFSSKYDRYLKGKVQLTAQEGDGLKLFEGKAKCANCHVSKLGAKGELPLFTDYTYDNLGIPKNPLNPYYYEPQWGGGPAWIDEGLGGFLKSLGHPYETERGKFKVPTLRNVDLRVRPHHMVAGEPVKAYGHNGYFKSPKEIVHFYNTRDVLPKCAQGSPGEKDTCWPEPEQSANMNTTEVGNLGLSEAEEEAIVAFLKTLSDGYGM
jgi:cytochrome c peroxidase